MTAEQEILWLAGLLEGEGCFHFSKQSQLVVKLKMTDRDVVERAAKIMGSSRVRVFVRSKTEPNCKDVYFADVQGKKAVSIMKQILPFMGRRRSAKIEENLALYSSRVTHSEGCRKREARKRRCPNTQNLFAVA